MTTHGRRRWGWVLAIFAVGGVAFAADVQYPANQPPLHETPYVPLPLGSVRAGGWLLNQLRMQRDGLTGHAETALVELDKSSAWLGGDKDNWERSPYYVKGLVSLAYTLDDAELKRRAQKWIDWCLASQRPDGSYGPRQNDDWWPRMVANYYLRDYHEATGDARVPAFLTRYYHYMLQALPARPLRDWGKSRAGDEMDTVIWLYDRTRDAALLDLLDLLRGQAYDWPAIMHDNTFQSFGADYQPKHNVNVPQAMKMPAVSWERTGSDYERTAVDAGRAHLMREHGLALGMESGTEFLAGRSPSQGVEFCSIVEQMLSDETVVRIFGEAKYSDQLEELAFNALPAAWNRDLTAIRYYTLPNHVIARRGPQGFGQNYDNGVVYGPRSGYPCCCFNAHQGWPKFVQNSWAATADGGLAALAYAPTTVTARVANGATVTIAEETSYPFDQTVRFRFSLSHAAEFPLVLRTPGWCEDATLTVNGERVSAPAAGTFSKLNRAWRNGDEVVLVLPMKPRVCGGVHNSVTVRRGPLLYALRIDADKHVVGRPAPGFDEFEETPRVAWNYALAIDPSHPEASVELLHDAAATAGANPFTPDGTPVKLTVLARRLPGWGLTWNGTAAADPPVSPVQSSDPETRITLVPFGAEDLRVSNFPVLGPATRPVITPVTFDFNDKTTAGWSWYGGGWWAHDGQLRTTFTGGLPGFKALVESSPYSDFRLEADVTPPPTGDAGVVFRVTRPSIGADAYQGYYAGISADTKCVLLGRADGHAWTPLKTVPRDVPADKPTRLTVTARGRRIEVRVNDEPGPIATVDDDHWTSGQVGVRVYCTDNDHPNAAFDNVRVAPLSR